MGVKLRMKLAITSLLVLVGAASAQMQTVEDRVESGMNVWATTMAHCRENSGEGDKVDMKKLPESNFDQVEVGKVLVCWENVHLKNIGEKCLKATGGKDMVLAMLCMMNHLRQDHQFAEQVILGEDPEEQGDPTKPSKLQRVLESLFVEGRCIHANEGNNNRIAECVTCFNRAMPMHKGKKMMMEKHMMEHSL